MTASVQQDALLGKFAVLAYADPSTVEARLATDPASSGWEGFLQPYSVNMTPGMAVSAEIATGRRRLITFFLDPLRKTTTESMKER